MTAPLNLVPFDMHAIAVIVFWLPGSWAIITALAVVALIAAAVFWWESRNH